MTSKSLAGSHDLYALPTDTDFKGDVIMRRAALFTIAAFAALLCGAGLALAVSTDQVVHVNRTSDPAGVAGNADGNITANSISGDLVAFWSNAANLPGANGSEQAYVRNTTTNVTTIASTIAGPVGAESANVSVYDVSISGNGRYVVYTSAASNLFPGDGNSVNDVFRYDRQTGTTVLISIDTGGGVGNAVSGSASISADGNRVAFWSDANDLVAGDTNAMGDAFVRDVNAGTTTRVSIASSGAEGGGSTVDEGVEISADGTMVSFTSFSGLLAPGDTLGVTPELYIRSVDNSVPTELVSVSHDSSAADGGMSARPSLSTDGRHVAFESAAGNIVPGVSGNHTYVRDRVTDTTVLAGRGDGAGGAIAAVGTSRPSISDDGRFVAFVTESAEINPNSSTLSMIHVRDTTNGTTTLVSRLAGAAGELPDDNSFTPAMAPAGDAVAFRSNADNLSAATSADNQYTNAFLRGYAPRSIEQPPAPQPTPPADTDPLPKISSLKFSPSKFRPAKTKNAKRGGTKIRIVVSEPVTVTGVIAPQKKGSRPLGRITFKAKEGATNYRFNGYVKGKRLKPGKYTATFTFKSATGQGGDPTELRVRIVAKL